MSTISRKIARSMGRRQNLQVWRLLPATCAFVEAGDTVSAGLHVQLTSATLAAAEALDTIEGVLHFVKWEASLAVSEAADTLSLCKGWVTGQAVDMLASVARTEAADTVESEGAIT
jgi:C4-type Zn-finger protein